MTPPTSNETLYFGYGSNLWLDQMSRRCPHSTYLGVGRLPNYRWHINGRGYANVLPPSGGASGGNEVYGFVYRLTAPDERRLDRNEGVPECYVKEKLAVTLWAGVDPTNTTTAASHSASDASGGGDKGRSDLSVEGEVAEMLVYVDHRRTEDGKPRDEYVHRMNAGIVDALRMGVPESYVDGVMRRYIPEEGDDDAMELAMQQADEFREDREGD